MAENSLLVFISYAHVDEAWKDKLRKHLSSLEQDGLISNWHDRKIVPGSVWDDAIKAKLRAADIILLLVSSDFIDSRYSNSVEMTEAMRRNDAKEARVIPIVLKDCDWSTRPYAKLQAFPKDGKPVTDSTYWPTEDAAFKSVAVGLRQVVNDILEERQQQRDRLEETRGIYRKKAEEVMNDGEVSVGERDTLDELRDSLGLSLPDAMEIERQARQPIESLNKAQDAYRKTLLKWIAREWPISAAGQADLDLRKRDLGLKDSEVAAVEIPILAQAQAMHASAAVVSVPVVASATTLAAGPPAAPPVARAAEPPESETFAAVRPATGASTATKPVRWFSRLWVKIVGGLLLLLLILIWIGG